MKKITVIISDDHTVFRAGLRLLLDATDDIEVIGEAENGHRAVGEAKRLRPNLMIMDIAMPLLNGVEAARKIALQVPATKVLILSSYSDDQCVQKSIAAGVAGYLMKEAAATDLLQAIRDIYNGNAFFSPAISKRLLNRSTNGDSRFQSSTAPALTSRQTEVVQLIAEGFSSKQMAELLTVSIKTIEKHRQAAMKKLNIHEVATLTRYAISSSIVESKPYSELTGHAGTHALDDRILT